MNSIITTLKIYEILDVFWEIILDFLTHLGLVPILVTFFMSITLKKILFAFKKLQQLDFG